MAAFEEFVHVEHSSALSFEQSAGKLCCVNPVRTRARSRGAAHEREEEDGLDGALGLAREEQDAWEDNDAL
jgi:hypothetical protein